MIALVEGARAPEDAQRDRAEHPAGRPHDRLPLLTSSRSSRSRSYSDAEQSLIVLVALLVCLIPTTIGGLLSAIGIAGMDRLVRRNVLALSGRPSRPPATARRCCSTRPARSRSATGRRPSSSRSGRHRARARRRRAAREPRRRDARGPLDRRPREGALRAPRARDRRQATLVPFTAQTRMSGIDLDGRRIRKGAADAIRTWVERHGGTVAAELGDDSSNDIATSGGTPLVVADGRARARRRPAQGRRQGGPPRALRGAPGDGDPDGDDHR